MQEIGTKCTGGGRLLTAKWLLNHMVESLWKSPATGLFLIGQVAVGSGKEPQSNIWAALVPSTCQNNLPIDGYEDLFTSQESHYNCTSYYNAMAVLNCKQIYAVIDIGAVISLISRVLADSLGLQISLPPPKISVQRH